MVEAPPDASATRAYRRGQSTAGAIWTAIESSSNRWEASRRWRRGSQAMAGMLEGTDGAWVVGGRGPETPAKKIEGSDSSIGIRALDLRLSSSGGKI